MLELFKKVYDLLPNGEVKQSWIKTYSILVSRKIGKRKIGVRDITMAAIGREFPSARQSMALHMIFRTYPEMLEELICEEELKLSTHPTETNQVRDASTDLL